ncbi:PDDEXK nuclease domain-containing protein [Arsenicicoccus dermatophilus]|uniref:PDDEXK nuclease domain-containing protein n=1 Tax=Arsenicicoccus dermatophilus TaxID=1076331 RepID=UPI001F4C7126|nr:PDDEXK nuclease domain-containing protein [Arsenicicoccus dermatophilus]MCH8612016.1 PDDEXK nuclease domain-containing protein [Arsenicicoccus dermatophilus]
MSSLEREPQGYGDVLARVKGEIRAARTRAQRVVNTQLLELYWVIGHSILERQESEGWGSKVVDRFSDDLRAEFPDMKGLGRANVHSMRRFAAAWTREQIVQQAVGQLPWGHVVELLTRVPDPVVRDWYAEQAVLNVWSRAVLHHQIATRLHERLGAALVNFDRRLDEGDSARATQIIKDPYVFDFLALDTRATERDLEQALMDRITDTLLELGRGFAFVGRQVHFDVDGNDFYADLVFFHVEQLRYVVVELKIDHFRPEHAGQLGFYVALVDDKLRNPDLHAPTIGLLLCATRSDAVVRYALANSSAPMAVADYTTQPSAASQMRLPSPEELEAIVDATLDATPEAASE